MDRTVDTLSDASNLLCPLNPQRFAGRRDLLRALQPIEYDALVIPVLGRTEIR